MLDVWLASISILDASVQRGFAGGLLAELLNFVTSRYRKGKNRALFETGFAGRLQWYGDR